MSRWRAGVLFGIAGGLIALLAERMLFPPPTAIQVDVAALVQRHAADPAAFQRLGAVVADQPPALCQRQAGFGVTPLLRRQAVGSFVHHLTAPVMPLAKLFCRQRKMIAVGSVQIRTPSISIP